MHTSIQRNTDGSYCQQRQAGVLAACCRHIVVFQTPLSRHGIRDGAVALKMSISTNMKPSDGTSEYHSLSDANRRISQASRVIKSWNTFLLVKKKKTLMKLLRQARGDAATFSGCVGLKDDTPDVREFPPEVSWKSQLGDVAPEGNGPAPHACNGSPSRGKFISVVATGACGQINGERLRIVFIVSTPHGSVETERVVTLRELFFLQMLRNMPIQWLIKKANSVSHSLLKNWALLAFATMLLSQSAKWNLLPVLANSFLLAKRKNPLRSSLPLHNELWHRRSVITFLLFFFHVFIVFQFGLFALQHFFLLIMGPVDARVWDTQ